MEQISTEQIRRFRLHTHHLDKWHSYADVQSITGAYGFQNSPPGAWEGMLYNRIREIEPEGMRRLLEVEKTLLQAWSFRGAPVVFPTSESDVFLSALVARQGEPWAYTRGIQLALDFLQMPFDELLALLVQAMPRLDGEVLKSKTTLDQTLAGWMLPLLPIEKREGWNAPSMYGAPDRQTVGGAVVSFLLRPCSFLGLVVFGKREGTSPTFTSYKRWVGRPLEATGLPEQKLVRKYLHCFGPASVGGFAEWLGCSPAQAQRMWQTVREQIEPVGVSGKERAILSEDKALLVAAPQPERTLHLLVGHDPYLGLQDRELILENKARQRKVWQTVANPGAVLWQGAVAGTWQGRKTGAGLEVEVALWDDAKLPKQELREQIEAYAQWRGQALHKITFLP